MATYYFEIQNPDGKELSKEQIIQLASGVPYKLPYPRWILNLSPSQQNAMKEAINQTKAFWGQNQLDVEEKKPVWIENFKSLPFMLIQRVPPFTKVVKYQPQPESAPWYWSKTTIKVFNYVPADLNSAAAIAYLSKMYDIISSLSAYADQMVYRFKQYNTASKSFKFVG